MGMRIYIAKTTTRSQFTLIAYIVKSTKKQTMCNKFALFAFMIYIRNQLVMGCFGKLYDIPGTKRIKSRC